MREPTSSQPICLTDQQTLHDTILVGQQHIPLSANGYRCQTDDLWRILLAAAANKTTIEATCADLERAPDANTVRGYLNEQLPPSAIPKLEQQLNDLLRSLLPDWLRARPQEIAVDFHDEPYYGRDHPDDVDNWVCRGEARAGTTRFYRCATAYLLRQDVRLTLAVVFIKPKMDKVSVLASLLKALKDADLTIKCLYADKAFCSIEVVRYLKSQRIAAIIAMPIRGKQGGTRKLCRGGKSHWTSYTMQSAEHGSIRVVVAVGAYLSTPPFGAATSVLVAVRVPANKRKGGAGEATVSAPVWDREWLPTDGAGASAHDLAEPGAALPVDGSGVVDCECVDTFALAVPATEGARTTARRALALSTGAHDALSDTRD